MSGNKQSISDRIEEKIIYWTLGVCLTLAVGSATLEIGSLMYMRHITSEFNQVYRNVLMTYADSNGDGNISATEQSKFNTDIIKGKNMYLIHSDNWPKYKHNNKKVDVKELTELVKNYRPE